MKKVLSTFGQCTAKIMKSKLALSDLKQQEVADSIGVSQSQFSKILRGERSLDVDLMAGFCDCLGLDMRGFIDEVEELVTNYMDADRFTPASKFRYADEGMKENKAFDYVKRSGPTYFQQNQKSLIEKSLLTATGESNESNAPSSDESDAEAMLKSFSDGDSKSLGLAALHDENQEQESQGGDGR
jgi:transcriptional regulator with XRE-family HTH domain